MHKEKPTPVFEYDYTQFKDYLDFTEKTGMSGLEAVNFLISELKKTKKVHEEESP